MVAPEVGPKERAVVKRLNGTGVALFSCLCSQKKEEKRRRGEGDGNGRSNDSFAWREEEEKKKRKKTTTERKRVRWEWYLTGREAEASVRLHHWQSSNGAANPLKRGGRGGREARGRRSPIKTGEREPGRRKMRETLTAGLERWKKEYADRRNLNRVFIPSYFHRCLP